MDEQFGYRPLVEVAKALGIDPQVIWLWAKLCLVGSSGLSQKIYLSVDDLQQVRVSVKDVRDLARDLDLLVATERALSEGWMFRRLDRIAVLLSQELAERCGLIPISEAAKRFGLKEPAMNMLARRKCDTVKIGGRRYIVPNDRWFALLAERKVTLDQWHKTEFSSMEFIAYYLSRQKKAGR